MSYINEVRVKYADSGAIDAFNRLRVADPYTIFDSKQLYDKDGGKIVWDEVLSGVGALSSHSSINASVTMSVANNNEYVIRQTKMRFNYQPGKSQLFFLTGILSPEVNIVKRVGAFYSGTVAPYTPVNGIYLENNGTVSLNIVKNGVTNTVNQSSWNVDTMDGNGPSKINLNFAKAQIFVMDFEWLGVGRVRCGFVIDGIAYYCHYFNHANNVTSVYMSSPNLPVRYEIRSTGGSGSMQHICSAVMSEGGLNPNGYTHAASTGITPINVAATGNGEALLGIRLKSTHAGVTIIPKSINLITTDNAPYRWYAAFNPTLSGTAVTWSSFALHSGIEYAIAVGNNAITNVGSIIIEGFGAGSSQGSEINSGLQSLLTLGMFIDGTVDTLWVCCQPLSSSKNYHASIGWVELS